MLIKILLAYFAVLLLYVSIFFSFGVGLDKGSGKPDGSILFVVGQLFGFAALFVASVVNGRD